MEALAAEEYDISEHQEQPFSLIRGDRRQIQDEVFGVVRWFKGASPDDLDGIISDNPDPRGRSRALIVEALGKTQKLKDLTSL